MLRVAFVLGLAVGSFGCSDRTGSHPGTAPATPGLDRVASTRGSAIVLTGDETVAVAANRSAGAISVLRLDPSQEPANVVVRASPSIELDCGAGSEPWASVIGVDDDTAYVVLRGDRVVQRVTNLHGTPKFEGRVAVGPEPTAISISPTGNLLFVANWGDGTLSVIRTTPEFEALPIRIDMNQKLAESGVLGDVLSRPGLAHPRALAMTDNGDDKDGDEHLFLTEFFSQPLEGVPDDPDLLSVDRNRQGFVYSFPVSGAGVMNAPVLKLAPIQETGYADAEQHMTGCFPNQLYAAAVDGGHLFTTAMCTSPRGPIGTAANVKTALHPTIFVTDTATGNPLPPVILTREIERLSAMDGTGPDLRLPLIPNDIAVGRNPERPGIRSAYVTAFGADAVFRVDFGEDGTFVEVGSNGKRFIDLRPKAGLLPIGIALSTAAPRPFALALNDNSQTVSVIDRATDSVVSAVPTTGKDPETDAPTRANATLRTIENSGRRLFATGLDVWSLGGQAWSSCESCHPDGQSDNVTWFFARGPRRTISTAPTYDEGSPKRRRIMLWTANVDEILDVEGITRSVSGGVGGILWNYHSSTDCRLLYDGKGCSPTSPPGTCLPESSGSADCGAPKHTTTLLGGLNGSLSSLFPETPVPCELTDVICDTSLVTDWNAIDAYIQSVRGPRSPRVGAEATDLPTPDVDAGIRLFRDGRCAACHGGEGWTISKLFYTPSATANGALPYVQPTSGILSLIGSLRTTTYEPGAGFPRGLNPPTLDGAAPLRSWAPEDDSDASALEYAYVDGQPNDQINCALRAVGTFPTQPSTESPNTEGIVAPGAPAVHELRQDMKSLAFGASGFNVPSLLGLATRAPYYHAGNARTLEEAFDPVFKAHYQAMVSDFLADSPERTSQVRALVKFLLSIDESTPIEPIPENLGFDPVLCPTQ